MSDRRWLARRAAVAVPALAAAVGVVLIVAGFADVGRASKPNAGRLPPAALAGHTGNALTAGASDSATFEPHEAPTIAVGPVTIAPASAPSGVLAGQAGRPIGANPVPIRLIRLDIPALGVSAPVVDVGVQADGQLQIPSDPHVLGRWSGGAEPDEPYGATVVAGHVDTTDENGALFALHRLRVGDVLVALGADGRSVTYEVSATREVPKAQLVTSLEPFQQDVPPRLVVVTCGGAFDPVNRQYADNVVVFALPVRA